jgi:hypothetical protein
MAPDPDPSGSGLIAFETRFFAARPRYTFSSGSPKKMQAFKASSPRDRVLGASVRAFVSALGFYGPRGLQILAENGIPDPQPSEWYPLQSYLDAQRAVYEKVGPNTLARIGRKLVQEATFPPQLDSIHDALSTLNDDYHLRHDGSDVGGFRYERTGDRSCTVQVRNPYPCELDRNVVEELCRRFKPDQVPGVHVRHVDEQSCRKQGADACVLKVWW